MMSNSGHVMTLANSIIGVGILAMPFCFQKCGVILSIVLLVISTLLTRISCHYLIKSSLLTRRKSFEFLGFHSFGSSGKLMVELCIIGYLIGSCITYFVVVGDVGPQIIAKIFGLDGFDGLRTWVMVVMTIVCILPLAMLKNVDSLAAVCTASIGFYLCLVVKIVLESESHMLANDWQEQIVYWRPAGVLQCLPIFSMALSCQMQLFEVFESVNNQSLERLNAIVKNATWMCTIVYIAVGFFGYIAFCTQTFSGNILVNFTPTFSSDVIKIGFVLSVAFSFPLVIFPCRASIYSLLYRKGHADTTGYIPEARFKSITAFIVFFSLCIALLIPSIELVIGLVGSTIGIAICIIFPAACFRKIFKKESTERTLAQALIVGGCCLMILGTYANLSAIDEKRSGPSIVPVEVTTQGGFTSMLVFEKPKESVKEIPLQNLSQKVHVEKPDPLPVEDKMPNLAEKIEEKPKVNPPLPVDEVEQEVVKLPEEKPPEKKPEEKAHIEPTAAVQKAPSVTEIPSLSNAIANDAIKKDEEIAAEERQQKESDKRDEAKSELKELLEQKVSELREELEKQNKETQNMVAEKLGQVVEKVEEIERVVQKENKLDEKPNQEVPAKPVSVPNGPILGVLTENRISNVTKEEEKKAVFEPLSYKTGEILEKVKEVAMENANAKDTRVPLPLPLLINASQSQVNVNSVDKVAELNKDQVEVIPPDGEVQNKPQPVDVNIQSPAKSLDVKDNEVVAEKDKENIEAIRRDILEINKDQVDTTTILKSPREKRSASEIDFAKIDAKLQHENCLNEVNMESLLAHNGLDAKLQGLGRDLKSVTDEE